MTRPQSLRKFALAFVAMTIFAACGGPVDNATGSGGHGGGSGSTATGGPLLFYLQGAGRSGLATDATSIMRGTIRLAGAALAEWQTREADKESLDEMDHQNALRKLNTATDITLTTLRGEAALDVLANYGDTIDLMITDIVMPQMDGTQLIKHVRETRGDLKVICISGYAEEAFRKRLDNLENIHFLPKPFSLDQLAGKVKEVMR
mgnify:CR=1 FL=1